MHPPKLVADKVGLDVLLCSSGVRIAGLPQGVLHLCGVGFFESANPEIEGWALWLQFHPGELGAGLPRHNLVPSKLDHGLGVLGSRLRASCARRVWSGD